MFAIIKSGGRQYKVSVGEKLEVNRLAVEDGTQIELEEVLFISDADRSVIGSPFVENAKVLATVEGKKRGEKVIVFKYKSKKRYRHRRGHRQELTVLTIDDVIADGKSLVTGKVPSSKELAEQEQPEAPVVSTEAAPSTPEATTTDTGKKTRRRRTTKAAETESSTEE